MTAVVLVAAALIIVASTVVVDAASTRHGALPGGLPGRVIAQLHPAAPFSSLIRKHSGTVRTHITAKQEPAASSVPLDGAGTHASSVLAQPVADAAKGADSTQSGGGLSSEAASAPHYADVAVQLTPAQIACRQGQWSVDIPSAHMTFQNPLAGGTSLVGHWEAHVEGGSAAVPPISTAQLNQTVNSGMTDAIFTASDAAQPLLSAPESADYAYSVRLHITAPFDLASDWVLVPQSTGMCPQ